MKTARWISTGSPNPAQLEWFIKVLEVLDTVLYYSRLDQTMFMAVTQIGTTVWFTTEEQVK